MIVLDTHTVVWLAEAPELLSPLADETITKERQADGLAVSDKTLWELAMLITRGRIGVRTSLQAFLREVERNFTVLPINAAIAIQAQMFSDAYPKDPTDRVIGATALVHNMALLTKDDAIRASGEVKCIW